MESPQENSVLFALAELRKVEEERERLEDEKRAREEERIKAEEEARRERERHAERVAAAEARERVEAELRARDAEVERRIVLLRAELDSVRSDREALLLRRAEMSANLAAPPPRWKLPLFLSVGAACAVSVAAFVAGNLMGLDSRPTQEAQWIAEPPARVGEIDLAPSPSPPEPSLAVLPPEPAETGAEAPTKIRRGRTTKRDTTTRPTRDDLPDLDRCGDDPTCGAL